MIDRIEITGSSTDDMAKAIDYCLSCVIGGTVSAWAEEPERTTGYMHGPRIAFSIRTGLHSILDGRSSWSPFPSPVSDATFLADAAAAWLKRTAEFYSRFASDDYADGTAYGWRVLFSNETGLIKVEHAVFDLAK